MIKYLVELNIGIKLMEEPISLSREVICDTRQECIDFIKKQIENNAKVNIEDCEKRNNFWKTNSIDHRHEEMGMPKYEFGTILGEIVDCVVTWTKRETVNNFKSKIKRIFTKKDCMVTKKWYWWYNIYPIPYKK